MNSQTIPTKDITNYFSFLSPGDIRLKNSRIGIETVLYEYLDCGRSPEEIAQIYQSISLEKYMRQFFTIYRTKKLSALT